MKKRIGWMIIGILIVIILLGFSFQFYQYLKIKNAKIEVVLVDDLTLEFNEKKRVSDYIKSINGKIIDDEIIDSTHLGEKRITFEFINNDHIRLKYSFVIKVVDTVKPLIWLNDHYRVSKDSKIDLTKKILCGDNYDNNPKCTIEGEYDLSKIGDYALVFKAKDNSGNIAEQPFTLNVYEPLPSKQSTAVKKEITDFDEIVKKHKTERTKIGIDVSSWQGEIDFEKLKQAGVEFIIIRVGGTIGTNGDYFVDKQFIRNIKKANEYQIPVGIYFYSYANSIESVRKDAKWVLKQIKGYQIDLPVAFDWEEWSNFNEYHLSFFGLTSMAEVFLQVMEENGYQGMLYSSKTYLDHIWFPTQYDVWLAHYTEKTSYSGKYKFWQLCNNGRVDGIDGDVDIDIMYE